MGLPLGTDELDTGVAPAALKADGYGFVNLYSRVTSRPTAESYVNAGLGFALIFEYSATRSLTGGAGGAADGALYVTQLKAVGCPPGKLAHVNLADFAPTPGQMPAIEAYWRAFIGQANAWQLCGYGTSYVISYLWDAGIETLYWQNGMDNNGVSGSVVNPHAAFLQRVSHTLPTISGVLAADYDEDVQLGTNIQWWTKPPPAPAPDPPAPAPKPVPPAQPEGEDMPAPLTFTTPDGNQQVFNVDAAGRLLHRYFDRAAWKWAPPALLAVNFVPSSALSIETYPGSGGGTIFQVWGTLATGQLGQCFLAFTAAGAAAGNWTVESVA